MADTILLLGATGLFGGHLARQLLADGVDVVLAARSADKLGAFATAHGGRVHAFDRRDAAASTQALAEVAPAVVIDAAGPFQLYGDDPYRLARQVVEAGGHYLDLADASAFVHGIGTLDDLARGKRVAVLSGASSTPALSSAAVDALVAGLDHVEAIETAIMPGNRTERGLSVIRAILAQTGQPFRLWRGREWQTVHGWDDTRRASFRAGGRALRRLAALNETPEVALFPARYGARTVVFRAGLELGVLHHGLSAARWLVRLGLMKSLGPLSQLSLFASNLLKRLGSDTGGMKVTVLGRAGKEWQRREWDLVAQDGEGPKIPAQPAALLAAKLLRGEIAPGARPCLGELTLSELEAAMARFGVVTERRSAPVTPIFAAVLGEDFAHLAPPIQALHARPGVRRFQGKADVTGASGWLARLAARIGGFPGDLADIDVRVTIDADDTREVWTRDFDGHRFRSVLRRDGARATERFGPLTFTLGLSRDGQDLLYPVLSGRFLGRIPIPRILVPISETRESVDDRGRFTFDVRLSLLWGGLIAHYRGWLEPVPDNQP